MSKGVDKKTNRVQAMFNSIASKYDFLNHFLSLGIDRAWRRKLRRMLPHKSDLRILDVATGTADLAIEMSKVNPVAVRGVDISEEMLEVGRQKIRKKKLTDIISLEFGDSQHLNLESSHFDVVTCAFGVRNFENLEQGLSEMRRVLVDEGSLLILEFSEANSKFFSFFFNFYFRRILPLVGRIVSKDKEAYSYLPDSVREFPRRDEFKNILKESGFINVESKSLFFGIANIYSAQKMPVAHG